MSDVSKSPLKAHERAYNQAAAIAHFGGNKRIASALERAGKLPPGPPFGPNVMEELFAGLSELPAIQIEAAAEKTRLRADRNAVIRECAALVDNYELEGIGPEYVDEHFQVQLEDLRESILALIEGED